MATLPVYFEQRRVGAIDVDKSGPGARYDPDWIGLRGAFPISVTMPLKSERIGSDTFLPWAANLLPESEQLRTLGQILGMARSDVIGLLSAIGGDTAGALSIGQPGRTATVQWRPIAEPEELESLIESLPSKPFLVGDEGVSMSLAGGQTKLAVAVDDAGRVCIPTNGSPSTHILKPDTPRLCGSVHNEAFCLTLARRIKIPTSSVTTGQAGKRTYLLARRYDRADVGGRWRRLHQEDYCQALGKPPTAKYETNQTGICGPTLKDMFELTRRHMLPNDIVRLLDLIIFNVFGLQHRRPCQELFDYAPRQRRITCTDVRRHVRRGLGECHQEHGPENRRHHASGPTHGKTLATTRQGLNPGEVLDRVAALAKSVIAETQMAESEVAVMPAGRHAILYQTRQAIERRALALLASLYESGDVGRA